MSDNNDEDAPIARGTEKTVSDGIQTTVGEGEMPKVSGTDPALADKDPSEVSLEDLAGLDDDVRDAVMDIMSARDEPVEPPETDDDPEPTAEENDAEGSAAERAGDESGDDEYDPPDPRSLDETGLIDDDGNFPWEDDAIGTTDVGTGGVLDKFQYKKTPFEINEPADRRKFERHFDELEGVQEMNDMAKRRRVSDRYSQKVAQQCLTVEGTDIDDVYRVAHNGTHYVVPDPDGSKGVGRDARAEKLWESMTWFDRFKLGMRIGQMVLGERQFRRRVD